MGLSFIDKFQWAVAAVLEVGVFSLALRHRLVERQPFFTIYLGLLIFVEAVMAIVYPTFGIRSYIYFYIAWGFQALLVLSRGTSVYEVCKVLIAPFAGVWKLCRSVLLLISGVLVLTAIFAASQSGPRLSAIISTAERGLELAIVGVLLSGLAFCRYYRIHIDRYIAWLGLGFGFYSAVQVVNSTFLQRYALSYFPLWNQLAIFSFNIATVLWCFALWKPLPARKLSAATLRPGTYETIAPQVSMRLRELNTRLLEMWK